LSQNGTTLYAEHDCAAQIKNAHYLCFLLNKQKWTCVLSVINLATYLEVSMAIKNLHGSGSGSPIH
jgi:hypothetical protein